MYIMALSTTNFNSILRKFKSENEQNLKSFRSTLKNICNDLNKCGDPWVSLKEIHRECVLIRDQIYECQTEIHKFDLNSRQCRKKIEQNKKEIDEIKEDIEESTKDLENLVLEERNKREKLTNTHNALKYVTSYYEKFLDLNLTVEKEKGLYNIKVCFFKSQNLEFTYSVSLQENEKEVTWKLLSVTPQLSKCHFSALQKRLLETNNISALHCTMQKYFGKIKDVYS